MVTEVDDKKNPQKSGTGEVLTPGGGHRVGGGAVSLAGTRGFPPSHLVDTRRFVLGGTTTHNFLSKSLFSKVPGDRHTGRLSGAKGKLHHTFPRLSV